MSEKEINKKDIAGKTLDDLTEEELKAVQGQGDTEGDTIIVTTVTTAATFITKKPFCKK